jgi:hypothetical protein
MLKRIFAVVSEKEFYAFQLKAKTESLTMGQALAALVHAYVLDPKITLKQFKEHFDMLHAEEDALCVSTKAKLSEVER